MAVNNKIRLSNNHKNLLKNRLKLKYIFFKNQLNVGYCFNK